jgi:hypothetical protein
MTFGHDDPDPGPAGSSFGSTGLADFFINEINLVCEPTPAQRVKNVERPSRDREFPRGDQKN